MGVHRIRQLSVPRRLEASAALVYLLVFALLVPFGRPGLGLGHGFYLAIVLVALAGGPWTGAAAGVVAGLLFVAGELLGGVTTFRHVVGAPLEIRLVSYVVAGVAVGYFAQRARRMLGESLGILEELLGLARREVGTGALTSDGIAARIAERIDAGMPFALLVGDLDAASDSARRRAAHTVAGILSGDEDAAFVGGKLTVLATAPVADRAAVRASQLERALEEDGRRATFGWAFHPLDGDDALALFGVASERLQERRFALGEWQPAAVVSELRTSA
ncbi:MAG: hypothetical protein ACRDL2_13250 [Gaiellaceae bacterium]